LATPKFANYMHNIELSYARPLFRADSALRTNIMVSKYSKKIYFNQLYLSVLEFLEHLLTFNEVTCGVNQVGVVYFNKLLLLL